MRPGQIATRVVADPKLAAESLGSQECPSDCSATTWHAFHFGQLPLRSEASQLLSRS